MAELHPSREFKCHSVASCQSCKTNGIVNQHQGEYTVIWMSATFQLKASYLVLKAEPKNQNCQEQWQLKLLAASSRSTAVVSPMGLTCHSKKNPNYPTVLIQINLLCNSKFSWQESGKVLINQIYNKNSITEKKEVLWLLVRLFLLPLSGRASLEILLVLLQKTKTTQGVQDWQIVMALKN